MSKETMKPAFTQLSLMDFGPSHLKKVDYKEQIVFGLWHNLGGWAEPEEVQIRWFEDASGLKAVISEFCDIAAQREIHPELFELLKDPYIQPEVFKTELIKFGYTNVNHMQ
ncbi:hypothetical protein [Niallia taxi]|uniref:hypothetical protein n=1 Tax=Niallia taxi TaxID=2499688 RepID=UPI0015F6C39A|nr:hypothetical protein [Niallia taxi]